MWNSSLHSSLSESLLYFSIVISLWFSTWYQSPKTLTIVFRSLSILSSALFQINHCFFRTFISQIHPKGSTPHILLFSKTDLKDQSLTSRLAKPMFSDHHRRAHVWPKATTSSFKCRRNHHLSYTSTRHQFKTFPPSFERSKADLLKATIIDSIEGGMNLHAPSPVSAWDPRATRTTISLIWHLYIEFMKQTLPSRSPSSDLPLPERSTPKYVRRACTRRFTISTHAHSSTYDLFLTCRAHQCWGKP